MYQISLVQDAILGSKTRSPTDADSMLTIHDDGTVTIPPDVEVVALDDCLWFHTPRLLGWNGVHQQSPIIGDPSRAVGVAIREELSRTGRTVRPWTSADADAETRRRLWP